MTSEEGEQWKLRMMYLSARVRASIGKFTEFDQELEFGWKGHKTLYEAVDEAIKREGARIPR